MTKFIELTERGGNRVTINVDAVETVTITQPTSRTDPQTLIWLRSGRQLFVTESYDQVHAQLYAATVELQDAP